MYDDLAWTWPIISPPEDYIEESEHLTQVIREHAGADARSLLHLGCGGGHNDHTFNLHFNVTGVDLSSRMLELARRLNPEVMYHEGDMRSVRLRERFDAVALLDSVAYMLGEEDLRSAFETAFVHLRPGGVMVTYVEQTLEGFEQNRTTCTARVLGKTEIIFIENQYDPDPTDSMSESTFVYLIRESGNLKIETDRHLSGLFTLDVWHESLRAVGFEVRQVPFEDPSQPTAIPLLVCTRPA
jgi:SAM-dependent methyltransferase